MINNLEASTSCYCKKLNQGKTQQQIKICGFCKKTVSNELNSFKKDSWYHIKFVDHNLRTSYDGDLSEITFEFKGKYKEDSENLHIFYLVICSDEKYSDIFQVAKGSIINFKEIV